MLEDILRDRRKKLARIREAGVDPYPPETRCTHRIEDAFSSFASFVRTKKKVVLVGRIMGLRDQGGVVFLDLQDETGAIQAVLKKENCSDFAFLKGVLDIGDFLSVEGKFFVTTRGAKSIEAKRVRILAKSLRPIPSEWYGIEDEELRLRKRYLDLLLHPELRDLFRKKSIFWNSFREMLLEEEFLEVENPVLEEVPGGADAEPFVTHHHALDHDFYLRISLELPLKKLIVAGFERVFEIGRIFRNEGISREHLQDYTQLEFYGAYHDYRDLMKFVEKMYKRVVKNTCGTFTTHWQGKKINWGKKWGSVDYVDAFKKANGIDPLEASRDVLYAKAKALGLVPEEGVGKGRLIDLIFKKTVRPTLIQPCFLVDPPVDIEPLAKRHRRDPRKVERIQVMACGTELGKGFSELNDPIDQRLRFEEQMKLREQGDKEAQRLDEDYVEAMEYGMPPIAGFGVSERLFAVLMDKPVRETQLFPLLRPEKK